MIFRKSSEGDITPVKRDLLGMYILSRSAVGYHNAIFTINVAKQLGTKWQIPVKFGK